jgi:hypothetical protein
MKWIATECAWFSAFFEKPFVRAPRPEHEEDLARPFERPAQPHNTVSFERVHEHAVARPIGPRFERFLRITRRAVPTDRHEKALASFHRHSPDSSGFAARIPPLSTSSNSRSPSPREKWDRSQRLTGSKR